MATVIVGEIETDPLFKGVSIVIIEIYNLLVGRDNRIDKKIV